MTLDQLLSKVHALMSAFLNLRKEQQYFDDMWYFDDNDCLSKSKVKELLTHIQALKGMLKDLDVLKDQIARLRMIWKAAIQNQVAGLNLDAAGIMDDVMSAHLQVDKAAADLLAFVMDGIKQQLELLIDILGWTEKFDLA